MATPIFLYPSLTDEIKEKVTFQARAYSVFYTNNEGVEKELNYESLETGASVYCLKTDGVWNADKYNLQCKTWIIFGLDIIGFKTAWGRTNNDAFC